MTRAAPTTPEPTTASPRPRLAFLGVGWIGRHRMQALADADVADIVGIADASDDALDAAGECAGDAARGVCLDDLFDEQPDGIVIATPSALHAEQAIAALQRGCAVFCQKPLGRTAAETQAVLDAARDADRLLGVDFSYRFCETTRHMRELIDGGALGDVYAADLVFHNAYGPDKPWFYDPSQSGGGCVMDLGIHLADLALWLLGGRVERVESRLFAGGRPLEDPGRQVEDYAVATLHLSSGAVVRLACSWNLPAGRDAVIEARFFGTDGGATIRNVNGSFYDFLAEHHRGTSTQTLCKPPDAWGGRALAHWARALADGGGFDPAIEPVAAVSQVIDRIYGRTA